MPGGELSITVREHPSGLWLGVLLSVAGGESILMVLDTGSPISVISPHVAQDLRVRGALPETTDPHHYWLRELAVIEASGEATLPDIRVRVLPRLAPLQVDGLLGLDFFRRFDLISFRFSTSRLLLQYPDDTESRP
jgi:hypothetical protein